MTFKVSLFGKKGSYDMEKEDIPTPKGLLQTRYIFCVLVFFGKTLTFADRMVLNVAIVAMVDRSK